MPPSFPKKYDFVVFGATGFTGARVVELLASGTKRTWAVAGRSRDKLDKVLAGAAALSPGFRPDTIETLIADTSDYDSLVAMARRARVVLNLVGPYRFHGMTAMRACIEAGAHHVDVSGEPVFLEMAERDLNAAAESAGVTCVTSAGFDSIPADVGMAFAQAQVESRGGACAHAESFLRVIAPKGFVGHSTTLECAVHGFSSVDELTAIRKSIKAPRAVKLAPRLPKHGPVFRAPHDHRLAMRFPGADASVVRRSQRRLHALGAVRSEADYGAYFTVGSHFWVLVIMIVGAVFKTITRYGWGRSLVIAHPWLFSAGGFSRQGPTAEQIEHSSFEMHFVARGDDGATVVETRVSGPEAGYRATPLAMVAVAEVILDLGERVPRGVLTPAVALHGVMEEGVERFRRAGIRFDVVV